MHTPKKSVQHFHTPAACASNYSHLLTTTFNSDFSEQVCLALLSVKERFKIETKAYYVVNARSYFYPIIHASSEFCELTGYEMHEVIGKNCGFLNGKDTGKQEVCISLTLML